MLGFVRSRLILYDPGPKGSRGFLTVSTFLIKEPKGAYDELLESDF